MTVLKAIEVQETASRRVLSRPVVRPASAPPAPSAAGESALDAPLATPSQEALTEAYRRGFADGMDEGRIQTEDHGERAAESLVASLGRAVEAMELHLSQSTELARRMTHLALDKLFGVAVERADLLVSLIDEQLRRLDRRRLLKLEVASTDFPDNAILQDVLGRHGLDAVDVHAAADAPSGTCRLHYDREIIDAGLTTQLLAAHASVERVFGHAE